MCARERRNQNSWGVAEGTAGENLGRGMRWFVDTQAARGVRYKLSGQLVSAGRLWIMRRFTFVRAKEFRSLSIKSDVSTNVRFIKRQHSQLDSEGTVAMQPSLTTTFIG